MDEPSQAKPYIRLSSRLEPAQPLLNTTLGKWPKLLTSLFFFFLIAKAEANSISEGNIYKYGTVARMLQSFDT
jgi:hypothetical protein